MVAARVLCMVGRNSIRVRRNPAAGHNTREEMMPVYLLRSVNCLTSVVVVSNSGFLSW